MAKNDWVPRRFQGSWNGHRDLNFDSHKRFCTRDFACRANILDNRKSKKDCLNFGRNKSSHHLPSRGSNPGPLGNYYQIEFYCLIFIILVLHKYIYYDFKVLYSAVLFSIKYIIKVNYLKSKNIDFRQKIRSLNSIGFCHLIRNLPKNLFKFCKNPRNLRELLLRQELRQRFLDSSQSKI